MTLFFRNVFLTGSLFVALFMPLMPQVVTAQDSQSLKNSEELQKKLNLFPGERGKTDLINDYRAYISSFYLFSIGAGILVAVMMMMIGGMIWLTSAGNQGRVSKAQEYIVNAIIGVVLLLGSYAIIQAINPRLVQLEDANLPTIPGYGACIIDIVPNPSNIKDATASCRILTAEECKATDYVAPFDGGQGKGYHEGDSCNDHCEEYSPSDGGCS